MSEKKKSLRNINIKDLRKFDKLLVTNETLLYCYEKTTIEKEAFKCKACGEIIEKEENDLCNSLILIFHIKDHLKNLMEK